MPSRSWSRVRARPSASRRVASSRSSRALSWIGRPRDRGLVPAGIDDQVAAHELLVRRERVAEWPLRAPQDRPDPDDQLGGGEGLREVVVRTLAQAEDPVARRAARGQDQDRRSPSARARRITDRPSSPGSIRSRTTSRGASRSIARSAAGPVRGRDHRVALALQVGPDERDDLRVVVDDEDRSFAGGHVQHHRRPEGRGQP